MDVKLRSLIQAAERGERCPPIHVLTASAAISGNPAPQASFGDALREPLSEELWAPYANAPRGEAEERFEQVLSELRPTWYAMACASEDRPTTLTLAAVEVWPLGGGDGIALQALRVPLDAVTCWWAGAGTRLKAPRETAWGFGLIAPLGDG